MQKTLFTSFLIAPDVFFKVTRNYHEICGTKSNTHVSSESNREEDSQVCFIGLYSIFSEIVLSGKL